MDEIEIIKFQVEMTVSSLQSNILRYYDALRGLKRISQLLLSTTQQDHTKIEKWFTEEGFDICENGFFQSIPSLLKHRAGTLSHDAISYSCHPDLRFDEQACFHMYCHRNTGPYLADITKNLPNTAWIYFQSSRNIALQYPFIDQSTAITPDFDWSTYHTWISVAPKDNPERDIKWTAPSIDYAGEGLILSVSIPVYVANDFHGLWSIDLPMESLYHLYINKTHIQEQVNFITDYAGNIIIHPNINTIIDREKGSISQEHIESIGKGFAKLDLAALIAQEYGQMEVLLEDNRVHDVFYRVIPGINWIYFSMFPQDRMIDIINSKVQSALEKVKSGDYSYRLRTASDTLTLNELENSFNEMVEAIELQQKQLLESQQQLVQSEKLSAIGTLAGGIAHDFNNLLGVILGYAEIAKSQTQEDAIQRAHLDKILLAGNRAKELVAGILTFSRKTNSQQQTLQPVKIVAEAIKLLRPSLPATISIEQRIDETCGTIKVDATELHQVIMNLCTNAYHAMEDLGGVLTISLTTTQLSEADLAGEPSLMPGAYVTITIKDTGAGMEPAACRKIFEPYFTTKERGKGTGMGLAIVHGIVKSNGGMIHVNSTPEEGTTFCVYFPESLQEDTAQEQSETMLPLPIGNEKILFVDDEELLADIGKRFLENLGYSVTALTSSVKALELIKSDPDQFNLIITDQTMPEMTGETLAKEIFKVSPGMPIILCTGYSNIMTREKAMALGFKAFILKPIKIEFFAPIVRKVLDELMDAPKKTKNRSDY